MPEAELCLPVSLQYVDTDLTLVSDIWMKNLGQEIAPGWYSRKILPQDQAHSEHSSCIWSPFCSRQTQNAQMLNLFYIHTMCMYLYFAKHITTRYLIATWPLYGSVKFCDIFLTGVNFDSLWWVCCQCRHFLIHQSQNLGRQVLHIRVLYTKTDTQ